MKRHKVFAILVFVIAIAILASGAQAASLYVGSCGTPSYSSIQDAINAANPGDTVVVCPGTYNEAVTVDKGITLLGQDAIIKPGNTNAAIYVTANGATIQGFEIDGTAGTVFYGVHVFNANDVTVTKNTIHDMANNIYDVGGVGILFFGWDQGIEGAIIDRNTVYNTARMGIFLGGMNGTTYNWLLSTGTISRNNVFQTWQGPTTDGGGGIQINGDNGCTVDNNNVHHTGQPMANGFYAGIYLAGTVGGTVSRNNVHQNLYGLVIWVSAPFVEFGTNTPSQPTLTKNNPHNNSISNLWITP